MLSKRAGSPNGLMKAEIQTFVSMTTRRRPLATLASLCPPLLAGFVPRQRDLAFDLFGGQVGRASLTDALRDGVEPGLPFRIRKPDLGLSDPRRRQVRQARQVRLDGLAHDLVERPPLHRR